MSLADFLTATLASGPPPDAGMIALMIPILAIFFGSIITIVKMIFRHRERMAKIGMGIDPDAPQPTAGEPQGHDPNHYS
jgi:hypothetical protein